MKDKRENLRNSAAYALGKIGDDRAVTFLLKALEDENENVRSNAAEALGKFGDYSSAVKSKKLELVKKLSEETGYDLVDVKKVLKQAGGNIGDAKEYLKNCLKCTRCGRLFNIGIDATIMTMDEALNMDPGMEAFGGLTNQPDLVSSLEGLENLMEARKNAKVTLEKVRTSLASGKNRKWYCRYCNNDSSPYDYPPLRAR